MLCVQKLLKQYISLTFHEGSVLWVSHCRHLQTGAYTESNHISTVFSTLIHVPKLVCDIAHVIDAWMGLLKRNRGLHTLWNAYCALPPLFWLVEFRFSDAGTSSCFLQCTTFILYTGVFATLTWSVQIRPDIIMYIGRYNSQSTTVRLIQQKEVM